MDVIEIARQLGKAIQEDERYSDYVLAKEKNDNEKERYHQPRKRWKHYYQISQKESWHI